MRLCLADSIVKKWVILELICSHGVKFVVMQITAGFAMTESKKQSEGQNGQS